MHQSCNSNRALGRFVGCTTEVMEMRGDVDEREGGSAATSDSCFDGMRDRTGKEDEKEEEENVRFGAFLLIWDSLSSFSFFPPLVI